MKAIHFFFVYSTKLMYQPMFKEIKKHSNMKFKKTSKEIEKCLLNSHDYFILTERFLLHPV